LGHSLPRDLRACIRRLTHRKLVPPGRQIDRDNGRIRDCFPALQKHPPSSNDPPFPIPGHNRRISSCLQHQDALLCPPASSCLHHLPSPSTRDWVFAFSAPVAPPASRRSPCRNR